MSRGPASESVVFAVDDEKDNLDLIRRTLSPVCRIETFLDATEALAAARERPPDLFLLDYRMPGRNGVEFAADLRAAGVGSPVVFLTAYPQDPVVERAVYSQEVLWVSAKPYVPEHLRSEVNAALSLARFRMHAETQSDSGAHLLLGIEVPE